MGGRRLNEHLPLSKHAKDKCKVATKVLQDLKEREKDPESQESINEQLATLEALKKKDHEARHQERHERHRKEQQLRAQALEQNLEQPQKKLGDNIFGFPCFDRKPQNTAVGELPREEYEVVKERRTGSMIRP